MEIRTRIENGKAYLEFEFSEEIKKCDSQEMLQAALLQISDREGREVFRCLYPLAEEEPACAILLHPHLWNGLEDPYFYKVTLHFIITEGLLYESFTQPLPIYTLEEISGKGWFLNGKPFEVRAVSWDISKKDETVQLEKLTAIKEMGANTLYLYGEKASKELAQSCMEKGFVIWEETGLLTDSPERAFIKANEKLPECKALFSSAFLADTYYHYKAKWCKTPFVYINMNSIKKNEKQHLSLTVYSNQKKVALYTNGTLFEFLTGGLEYFFEEIPIKKYPLTLTAEAGECRAAVTIYETSHNFHKTITFS